MRWAFVTNCDSFFYYKVGHGLLQIATGITKCDGFITNCDRYYKVRSLQSNAAISNSVNSKSPLFRRKIEFPWMYPFPLRFPGSFETPLFRTFFHVPWDFEIAGFDCTVLQIATVQIPAIWLALISVIYSRITSGSKSHHFCFKSHHFRSILHHICVGYKMRRISLFVFAFQPQTGYQIK